MKKFLICITLILSLNDLIISQENINAILKREVSHLTQNFVDAGSLITNINSNGDFITARIKVNELQNVLQSQYKLPNQVVEKFKGIVFARQVTFQSFCLVLGGGSGYLEEFIGVARNINGNVEIIFLKVSSSGNLITQYTKVTERICHRIFFFFKKCKNYDRYVPRGLNVDEINKITGSLRWHAYSYLLNKVNSLRSIQLPSPSLKFLS
jgi:hypothetical protein